MNNPNKERWWLQSAGSFLIAFGIPLLVANSGWAQTTSEAILSMISPAGISVIAERVRSQSGSASLAALLAIWIMSPFALFSGYVLLRRILGNHIARITPSNPRAIAIRLLGALLVFAMVAYSVLVLPGADSVYCRGCEQNSLVFFVIVNCAQICCLGGIIGYVLCILSVTSNK